MLQTWAENGTPMLGLGDRLYKFMGVASVGWDYTGGAKSGTITDARFSQYPNCEAFAFQIGGYWDTRRGGCSLSIVGNTLTWTYSQDAATATARPTCIFMYGIY